MTWLLTFLFGNSKKNKSNDYKETHNNHKGTQVWNCTQRGALHVTCYRQVEQECVSAFRTGYGKDSGWWVITTQSETVNWVTVSTVTLSIEIRERKSWIGASILLPLYGGSNSLHESGSSGQSFTPLWADMSTMNWYLRAVWNKITILHYECRMIPLSWAQLW